MPRYCSQAIEAKRRLDTTEINQFIQDRKVATSCHDYAHILLAVRAIIILMLLHIVAAAVSTTTNDTMHT